MDGDDLARIVRQGDGKLRVDNLVLDDGTNKLTGKGYLRVKRKRLTIAMTLDAKVKASYQFDPRVVTKSEFWRLTGVLDHDLRFHCNFGPGFSYHVRNELRTFKASVDFIELEARGFGTLPLAERKKRWKKFRKAFNEPRTNAAFDAAEVKRLSDGSFQFEAHFVKHELRSMNEGTKIERTHPFVGREGGVEKLDTLIGETSSYKFAFIQADKGDDLRLLLRSKEDQPPLSEAEHWQKYHSLVAAVSFVHGINAWPYRLQYRRGGDTYIDRLFPARPAPRSCHSPFSGLSLEVNMAPFLSQVAERLAPNTHSMRNLRR